jgi:hypothetical protein
MSDEFTEWEHYQIPKEKDINEWMMENIVEILNGVTSSKTDKGQKMLKKNGITKSHFLESSFNIIYHIIKAGVYEMEHRDMKPPAYLDMLKWISDHQ